MLTIRYGPVPGNSLDTKRREGETGDRPQVLQLDWPAWEVAAPVVLGGTHREYVARVRTGSYTVPLEADPETFTLPLRYLPYQRRELQTHWARDLIAIMGLRGRYFDMLWGDLHWGEWRLLAHSIPMDVFGITPELRAPEDPLPQGMYPKQVDFSLTLRADKLTIRIESGEVGVVDIVDE